MSLQTFYELQALKNTLRWQGLPSAHFSAYKDYINQDNTCGIVASSVLLRYFSDYIDPAVLNEKYRVNQSLLIDDLLKNITSFSINGTMAIDVSLGINRFIRKQQLNLPYTYRAKSSLLPTFGTVKGRLSGQYPSPVIVGTMHFLNAPDNYKNHWVVVYAFAIDEKGEKYYLCHDNHGRYDAVIKARWTLTSVTLHKVKK